jgi:hypothetical protein
MEETPVSSGVFIAWWGSSDPPTAPQMTGVNPNRWGGRGATLGGKTSRGGEEVRASTTYATVAGGFV